MFHTTLPLPSIFRGLSEADAQSARARFTAVEVEAGVRLMTEGEHDQTLAVVEAGEFEVTDHGASVGFVRGGGLLGEMALFSNGVRRATVISTQPSRLLVLDRHDYDWLRHHSHPIAWAIEERALQDLTDRRHGVVQRLVDLREGEILDERARTPSLLGRAFRSGRSFRPSVEGRAVVLAKSPLFADAPEHALSALAEHFRPTGTSRGQTLCEEGQEGNELFVLASGSVDLLARAGSGTALERVETVASLGPGDAFGISALVRPGDVHRSTALARSRVTALALHKLQWAELGARGDLVGSVLRVALVRALIDQLDFVNETFAAKDPARMLAAAVRCDALWSPTEGQ